MVPPQSSSDMRSIGHLHWGWQETFVKPHVCQPTLTAGNLGQKFAWSCCHINSHWKAIFGLYWASNETVSAMEGHKIILRHEIPLISWIMSKKDFQYERETHRGVGNDILTNMLQQYSFHAWAGGCQTLGFNVRFTWGVVSLST